MNQLVRVLRHFVGADNVRRNSSLLILAQLVNAGGLFLFWIINARLFKANLVGLATAFISFGVLAATFTNLGLPNTIIRFLPRSKQKGGLFFGALGLVAVCSLIGGLVAIIIAKHYISELSYIHNSFETSLLLILLVVSTALSALLDGTLVAFRRGEDVFRKAIIVNLPRLVLPFLVVTAGVRGMTGVYVLTLFVGIVYNLFTILRRLLVGESLRPALGEVTKHKAYASSNYFGGMFGILPITAVPIIILSRLGGAPAAYFYMPMMIATLISLICNSISQALISECSQTENYAEHRRLFIKALVHQYQILLPLVVVLIVIGWPLLRIYGPEYASQGFWPMVILVVSGLLVGVNWLGDTWLNINKRSRDYFLMNAFNAVAVVVMVSLFSRHGLVWAAFGWFIGQSLSVIVYLLVFGRGLLIRREIVKE